MDITNAHIEPFSYIGNRDGRTQSGRLGQCSVKLASGSVLAPRQAMEPPATVVAPLVEVVQLAFEAFQDIECVTEPGFGERLRRRDRACPAAAQQNHYIVAAHFRLQLPNEARIALQIGADGPGHMDAVRHPPDKLPFVGGPYVHQHSYMRGDELPCLLRCDVTRVPRLRGRRTLTSARENRMRRGNFAVSEASGT